MENTSKILFQEDNTPKWYLALGDRWVGPLTVGDVFDKVLSHEISWAHFVWTPGQADWKRICDVKAFQAGVPGQPGKGIQSEVKAAVAGPTVKKSERAAPRTRAKEAPPEGRVWFLYYNDTQFGPFDVSEIDRYLRVGKLHGRVHAWKDGMQDWERLERLAPFEKSVEASKAARAAKKGGEKEKEREPARKAPAEQREAPRRPLVARLLMANDETVITAVCRDISVGGMQVLTDRVPGTRGTRLKLNVSGQGVPPFVAEGVIVRILEDGRGFSFRFDRLSDPSRKSIEAYVAAAG
jgi:hypothetical protein